MIEFLRLLFEYIEENQIGIVSMSIDKAPEGEYRAMIETQEREVLDLRIAEERIVEFVEY